MTGGWELVEIQTTSCKSKILSKMTFNLFVPTSLLSWNWFFEKEKDERSYFQLRITALFTRCVHQLPLYLLPWDSVLRKIGWLWFALYPFLFHRFQSKWPQPVCLDQADCPRLLLHIYPSFINEGTDSSWGTCAALWGLPSQSVCVWICHFWTWTILLTFLRLTFKHSCSQILAPHQPSQTKPFFSPHEDQPHSVR